MHVSVEDLGGLKRRITVQVPAQEIELKVKDRLVSLSRRVKLNGFRPGKVPFKLTRSMYGTQVREEIASEVMHYSYQEALIQEKLKPAGAPKVEYKELKEGEDLEYSATFEVLPEFELTGVEGLKVERPIAQVTEADVDGMIEILRKQNTNWTDVERACQLGDRVTVDFEGKLDGEDFPGNKGENVAFVTGAGKMIKDFEDALLGLQTGAETEFDATFPENYPAKELAAKTAHFKAKIHAVAEPNLPVVDAEFAAKYDVDSVEALRESVRDNMERELKEGIKSRVKDQLMDGLLNANNIPLPQSMIDTQIERMARQVDFPRTSGDEDKAAVVKEALFGQEARRRSALGLLMSKLVAVYDLKLEESRVHAYLDSIAATYQEAAQVKQWYERSPEAMEGIRALVMEDQVVDWLLERALVTDKPCSFDEVMKPTKATDTVSEESV